MLEHCWARMRPRGQKSKALRSSNFFLQGLEALSYDLCYGGVFLSEDTFASCRATCCRTSRSPLRPLKVLETMECSRPPSERNTHRGCVKASREFFVNMRVQSFMLAIADCARMGPCVPLSSRPEEEDSWSIQGRCSNQIINPAEANWRLLPSNQTSVHSSKGWTLFRLQMGKSKPNSFAIPKSWHGCRSWVDENDNI